MRNTTSHNGEYLCKAIWKFEHFVELFACMLDKTEKHSKVCEVRYSILLEYVMRLVLAEWEPFCLLNFIFVLIESILNCFFNIILNGKIYPAICRISTSRKWKRSVSEQLFLLHQTATYITTNLNSVLWNWMKYTWSL